MTMTLVEALISSRNRRTEASTSIGVGQAGLLCVHVSVNGSTVRSLQEKIMIDDRQGLEPVTDASLTIVLSIALCPSLIRYIASGPTIAVKFKFETSRLTGPIFPRLFETFQCTFFLSACSYIINLHFASYPSEQQRKQHVEKASNLNWF